MHNLFLKPCNAYILPLHIWLLAIELIITYVSFFINIGLGITIWILESMEIEHFFLIVIYWVILSIYLACELFLMLWLYKISTSIFDEELAYTQKEYEELLKEIEEIYPDYYKAIDIK